MDDFAAERQARAFDQLVVIRQHRFARVLVPEGAEEIVDIAREQSRRVGGQAPREIAGADDRDVMTPHILSGDAAFSHGP